MFRRGGYGGRSKATPTTTCQKCLKKGHYSYECTVTAQERPYRPRPSRTQQLLNPSLKPKLSEHVPDDLLHKKGLADKIIAGQEEERRKKSGRRARSLSSASDSGSVSTISTNRSRSRSRSPKRIENGKSSGRGRDALGKRGRRSVSTSSDRSIGMVKDRAERNTRRRLSSMSPEERGRRRSRSRSSHMDISHDEGSRSRRPRYHSRSRSHDRGRPNRRSRSSDRRTLGKRNVKRSSMSRSLSHSPNRMEVADDGKNAQDRFDVPPAGNGHERPVSRGGQGLRASTARSRSRSRINERSPSPYSRRRAARSPSPYQSRDDGTNRQTAHVSRRHRFNNQQPEPARQAAPPPGPPRERSLSPYSKRVALTRQMQGGR